MAFLAEVSIAPAEPLGNRAAELALKFDKLGSVRLALILAHTQLLGSARAAY